MKPFRYQKGTFLVVPNKNVLAGMPCEWQSVYFWICNYANDDGVCFPSIQTIANNAGVSKRKVHDCISRLENVFLLTKIPRKEGKKNLTNVYQINLTAEDLYESMDNGTSKKYWEKHGGDSAQPALGSAHGAGGGSAHGAERTQSIIELNLPNIAETGSALIPEVIKAFEIINPACKKMYSNKTERIAADSLLQEYGMEKILAVVNLLPKTNKRPRYEFPYIDKPSALYKNWAKLANAFISLKESKVSKYQPGKIIIPKK